MKKTILALTFLIISGTVHSAAINYLELTGGTFSMGGDFYHDISPGEFANMTVGGYDGGPRMDRDLAVNSIGYFELGTFGPFLVFTEELSWDKLSLDPNINNRPITGDITNGNLTLDLDSWAMENSFRVWNQGPNDLCLDKSGFGDIVCSTGAPVTTYDASTGAFTASWGSVIKGDSYNGIIGEWYIEGNVSAVPVPAAIWLFASGLFGLVGFARRKIT